MPNPPPNLETAISRKDELLAEIQSIEADLSADYVEGLSKAESLSEYREWRTSAISAKTVKLREYRFLKEWIIQEKKRQAPKPKITTVRTFESLDLSDPNDLALAAFRTYGKLFELLTNEGVEIPEEQRVVMRALRRYVNSLGQKVSGDK